MRNAFVDTVLAACALRDDVHILSGDAGLGVFDTFKEQHAHRFLNTGVAEQNAISLAAGLAMAGGKVFVYNIIPFLLYRCYEQVRNDVCYQRLPVVLVGIGSGIAYAPMGMSHYSVEDLGLAQTLPNLTVVSPMDPVEARAAARYALSCTGPLYVRLAKRGEPEYEREGAPDILRPRVVREGSGAAIVFHGSISAEVMAAYEVLQSLGRAPRLVSVPTVQPLDAAALRELLAGFRQVVSVEEHFHNCGLGSLLARLKAEQSPPWTLTVLGIAPHFIHEVGSTGYLRGRFGISAADIVSAVGCAGND